MSNSILICFLLVGSDGQPYKETFVDAVSLLSGSVVVQFRDAVKAKHSNKLASVDAADLKVFKDKAEFDDKKEPLKALAPMDHLGKTEEDALIVLVPPSFHQILDVCQLPFYTNIVNAVERDGFISFDEEIPDMTSTAESSFTQPSVSCASQTACDLLVRDKGLEAWNMMKQLMAACE